MNQITKISPQTKRDGYYNIFVNEAFFCSLSDLQLATLHLKVGQQLSDQEQASIKKASAITKTYNRALYYLQYGPRTTWQMNKYLVDKGYEPEYIDATIQTLIDEKYLNDELYAMSFVQDRQTFKPRSKRMLTAELRRKGIQSDTITVVLGALDENDQVESIKKIVDKKIKQAKYQDKKKLTEYLLRQGFSYSDIKNTLEDIDFYKR